jgi:hypothetical protein
MLAVSKMWGIFYIHGSVHRNSILTRPNKMQQYAGIYLLQNHSWCFRCPSHPSSGVHKTVTAASGTATTTFRQRGQIGHVGGRLLLRYYDLYQRLQLQFCVLLMMGGMDTRNMKSDFAVNKYLRTVASCWVVLMCGVYYRKVISIIVSCFVWRGKCAQNFCC